MIKFLDKYELVHNFNELAGKHIMLLRFQFDPRDTDAEFGAVPYLNFEDHAQILMDGEGYVVADTVKELHDIYHQTVGDDGPTYKNPYNGPCLVYALTSTGHENT